MAPTWNEPPVPDSMTTSLPSRAPSENCPVVPDTSAPARVSWMPRRSKLATTWVPVATTFPSRIVPSEMVCDRVPSDRVRFPSPAVSVKVKVPGGAPEIATLVTPVVLLLATAVEL